MPTVEIDNPNGTSPAMFVSTPEGTHAFVGNKASVSEAAAKLLKGDDVKVVAGDGGLVTAGGDPYDRFAAAAAAKEQEPAQKGKAKDPKDMTEAEKANNGLPNKAAGAVQGTTT